MYNSASYYITPYYTHKLVVASLVSACFRPLKRHPALGVNVCTGAVATGGGFTNFASGSGSSKT